MSKIIFNQIFFSIAGLILLVMISIPLAKNVSKRYALNSEIEKLNAEIADLQEKNSHLSGLMEYLGSDQFIDEQARFKLDYKKPGEEMVIIKDNDITQTAEAKDVLPYSIQNLQEEKTDDLKNINRWWAYFFNKKIQVKSGV